MPYRERSSGANKPGKMFADRSFCMPACLPLRKLAIFKNEVPQSLGMKIQDRLYAVTRCAQQWNLGSSGLQDEEKEAAALAADT